MASESPVTIYMPLLNRTGELRPVQAIRQREDIYVVIGPVPDGDEWRFPPGSEVRRKPRLLPNGKQEMIATAV